jgi:hypothetical protein
MTTDLPCSKTQPPAKLHKETLLENGRELDVYDPAVVKKDRCHSVVAYPKTFIDGMVVFRTTENHLNVRQGHLFQGHLFPNPVAIGLTDWRAGPQQDKDNATAKEGGDSHPEHQEEMTAMHALSVTSARTESKLVGYLLAQRCSHRRIFSSKLSRGIAGVK